MRIQCNNPILIAFLVLGAGLTHKAQSQGNAYPGKPYRDARYTQGAQLIPGKLQCEYYDQGGEGMAYHDNDAVNSGSGQLNKADGSYLHEFRKKESVDISYTKFQTPAIDNSAYNLVQPEKDQLYVGWTQPGEWIKYTIQVKEAGRYQLGIQFTANQNAKIAFAVNDVPVTQPIAIPATFAAADTVAWRQWHHWNYMDNIATIYLKKGIQTFTIHTVETGNMNYDFITFRKIQ